jgi:flagella basal body P-ring formation protein FlgA
VRAHARVSGLLIVGEMVAAESGHAGEVIRVINAETKHAARARVDARGEVEVLNVR